MGGLGVCGGGGGGRWGGGGGGLVGRQMVEVRDLPSISFCRTESPSHHFCKLGFSLFCGLTNILLTFSKSVMAIFSIDNYLEEG